MPQNGPMTFVSKNYVSWQRQVSGGEPSGLKKESKSQQRRCPGIAVEPLTALAMNMSSSGVGPDQRGFGNLLGDFEDFAERHGLINPSGSVNKMVCGCETEDTC